MYVLGLETSCDETAAAIVEMPVDNGRAIGSGRILANQILSQIETHAPYGGVVPELAARAHLSHLDRLIAAALEEAALTLNDMDAIAATAGPGLIGGVLIGLTTGKALALAADKPFIGINHLEGHALSARLTEAVDFPYLLLLVSGGHCQLLAVNGLDDYTALGQTLDDAVGEAYDKAAKLMSLGYPGGPEIEKRARHGNRMAHKLPRPLLNDAKAGLDFSFSGLKTALRQAAEKAAPLDDYKVADLAASFEAAVGDCLATQTGRAMRHFRRTAPLPLAADATLNLVVAGGVAANHYLRARLSDAAAAENFTLFVPPPALCTDNAAMIARAGGERF
ncbi:MAG: tRNA (adenosine(37)-N6)-threonylcarbamoyltransferase complex transferase subunit TsaD, partial [Parvibaculales bacterium]